eukprot:gene11284-13333_t
MSSSVSKELRVSKEFVVEFLTEDRSFTVAVVGAKEVAHQVVFGYIDASTEVFFHRRT